MRDPLLAHLPEIRRAREYRLYGRSGKRYTDFYQDGGRAILGHRPSRIILDIKNTLSRGLMAPYPSIYAKQAEKALKTLFPKASDIRLYRSFERALAAVEKHIGQPVDDKTIADPGRGDACDGECAFWRPFIQSELLQAPVLLPILPVPHPLGPAVVVFRERPGANVAESDICSPVSLIALKRGIFDMIRFSDEVDRELWPGFDTIVIWKRNGPYLSPKIDEEKYAKLFLEFLDQGIVISPHFSIPSIIPSSFTEGEVKYLNTYRASGDSNGNG